MSHALSVVVGPARSGKTTRLLCAYRQALAAGPIGGALWLSPTHRAAADVAERLLAQELPGCISPNLVSFDQLAARVLAFAAPLLRPISRPAVRRLLGRLVAEAVAAGRLPYFEPIAQTPGFLDLVVAFIRELKRLEIWPEELAATAGATDKDRQLCGLYQGYQDLLTRFDLYDPEGQFWAARRCCARALGPAGRGAAGVRRRLYRLHPHRAGSARNCWPRGPSEWSSL